MSYPGLFGPYSADIKNIGSILSFLHGVVLNFILGQLNVYLPNLTDNHNRDSTYGVVTRLRVERRRIRESTAERGKWSFSASRPAVGDHLVCYRWSWETSGRDIVVGITTGYGLDGSCFEHWWGRDLQHTSRPGPRTTQPPVQWVSRPYPGGEVARAWRLLKLERGYSYSSTPPCHHDMLWVNLTFSLQGTLSRDLQLNTYPSSAKIKN
jgi:hypothetical protein